ncbi:CD99 molecule isoform X1 [Perca flavescens]|uniref:CD99 molecule isoform X1 n=1 Tax=Perca flavescens TaxID=8167 RepID=UPI00106F080C|nr:CD99 antigen-like isoform X1 [Perca flavescens]XP_028428086.1 CD99 antigen-like isoform X1 [Perca flavescens]XP_028428087.1 CD99 antigen-like isoform X1 [Perca flavescens]XP_028428088.1 CD99 antigen-like isoform X1 [Perca flavescens]
MIGLRIGVLLLLLVAGTLTDDGFNLSDALDDLAPPSTPAKPKEQPKAPEKPKTDGGLELSDAFAPDEPAPTKKPKKPSSGDTGGVEFDLEDALGPDPNPKPDKPAVHPADPAKPRGGGSFGDSDLSEVSDGDYKPDGGRSGGGRAVDPGYNSQGGAGDQPQEAGAGTVAGIASAIGVALLGAASSYFAYQKKKLCFKIQGGADPESGKGQQSDPQVFSELLRTS